jgi:hypothetical protein
MKGTLRVQSFLAFFVYEQFVSQKEGEKFDKECVSLSSLCLTRRNGLERKVVLVLKFDRDRKLSFRLFFLILSRKKKRVTEEIHSIFIHALLF